MAATGVRAEGLGDGGIVRGESLAQVIRLGHERVFYKFMQAIR